MQTKQNDRMSFSFGMKLSLDAKYESADFHISLASDVKPGETSVDAFNRVKSEVEVYAALAYQQIRNSDTGLIDGAKEVETNPDSRAGLVGVRKEQPQTLGRSHDGDDDSRQGGSSNKSESRTNNNPGSGEKPRDTKALRQQIKQAFGVLEAQKKVTKADFIKDYLQGKRTDDLSETEVLTVIKKISSGFPELGL